METMKHQCGVAMKVLFGKCDGGSWRAVQQEMARETVTAVQYQIGGKGVGTACQSVWVVPFQKCFSNFPFSGKDINVNNCGSAACRSLLNQNYHSLAAVARLLQDGSYIMRTTSGLKESVSVVFLVYRRLVRSLGKVLATEKKNL